MWLLKKAELEDSGAFNLNFLFNQGKFYIMDNHLAAAWCWMQKIETKEKLGFFHIDRHYDLLNNLSKEFIILNRKLFTGTLSEYLNVSVKVEDEYSAVRFDNYIDLFRKLYPRTLTDYYFATHEDGTYLDEIKSYKPAIWDLQNNISYWIGLEKTQKWILNVDLDYFFQEKNTTEFQFLTDEYVISICREIEKAMPKIEVITIALSPGFCGGWHQAFRVLRLITDYFSIEFIPDWKIRE